MEAVLDVYQRPYDPEHPLLCLDESPKQLISEVRSPLTTAHGTTLVDYEYYREGVCDLYMVCESLTGRCYVRVRDTHTRLDWAAVVIELVNLTTRPPPRLPWSKIICPLISSVPCTNYYRPSKPAPWSRNWKSFLPPNTVVG
ncbi:MAG: hypothetical protein BroJett011_72140 [Chloroflexota bacterium]|nr:MAG: hypothetical protein BroJett011_72140 [Chloroflexota bacterium]